MPFATFFSSLPWPLLDIIMNVVAGLGAVLLTYGVFLETERRQDAVFIIASACLLVYSLWIGNKIFSIAMAGLMAGSFIELIEIMVGAHTHNDTLEKNTNTPNKEISC